ncbi:hypothetical protein Tco_0264379 [Tanacetum coccineum]
MSKNFCFITPQLYSLCYHHGTSKQHAAACSYDKLFVLLNKRYDLMDANKKVDLEHVQCPSESKILMNIIKNHPLRFSIAASAYVPWIYMAQTFLSSSYKQMITVMLRLCRPPYSSESLGRRYARYSPRVLERFHNLQDDDIMKNIFNSGRNKNKVGMRIPAWMITYEMKLTENLRCMRCGFRLDVPLTQSKLTELTHGKHTNT